MSFGTRSVCKWKWGGGLICVVWHVYLHLWPLPSWSRWHPLPTTTVVTAKNVTRHHPVSPVGKNCLWLAILRIPALSEVGAYFLSLSNNILWLIFSVLTGRLPLIHPQSLSSTPYIHIRRESRGSLCTKLHQSCLTLCDLKDYTLPGSSAHGVLQARILEWVAISFSRGSSPPRDRTHIS